ncbi:hypothetical protein [Actinomycetospora corticicola]|uniref:Uncharacterized protein n=1 Tax=Actinomycetospora corticicola TaxID=663602 RepID=A0A7Y9J451_9PSEU|nr:hypothetical protein [Actinomycetospora corticicola]NYD34687.1 hypothetical protein [Actinomycetospora corticicola]
MSGDTMMITAAAAVGATAAAWLAAPFVAMARRGTLDDQARAALRAEADRAGAISRARRREALVAAASGPEIVIPAPRAARRSSPAVLPA